ncbi:MAG: hypothetical protein CVV64_19435 [Candidatus Wallbacteria bacterium HGW-Wallbacteria-1]|jgi:hypothetical protein|uniref:Tail specific protease domain-containing protein n=1 Tax=Candidatus Wallbacteria bacterium HGW-Wallbacteria-1 TaxID=2013854 RepID=A0A2N1PIX6_9BACT|nr:MAG: hypothetical protein CVV64_19435 [Candidatus Wallbacteria bacterium HGW-Wallbacteria-1]
MSARENSSRKNSQLFNMELAVSLAGKIGLIHDTIILLLMRRNPDYDKLYWPGQTDPGKNPCRSQIMPTESPINSSFTTDKAMEVFQKGCVHIESNIPDSAYLQTKWPETKKLLATLFNSTKSWQAVASALESLASSLPFSHAYSLNPFGSGLTDKVTEALASDMTDEMADMDDATPDATPAALQFSWRLYGDSLYLRIPSFKVQSFPWNDIVRVLSENLNCRRLFLDLRLNDGGSFSEVGRLLGVLAGPDICYCETIRTEHETGTVLDVRPFRQEENHNHEMDVKTVSENGHTKWYTPSENPLLWQSPIILLTGSRTYSCGELFAQAAMEICSPISAGTTTAGMVLPARDDFDCGYGFGLCLPFARIFTPSGLELEGKGMSPQLEINFQTPDTEVMPGVEIASLLGMIE